VAFWNTSMAMSQLGGMPVFVANGWAAKDYTHINFYGGKRIATELANAIVGRVRAELERREAEQIRLDSIERARIEQQNQMREIYLQSQIESVRPIIDSVVHPQTE
jgi:hypothetical protein